MSLLRAITTNARRGQSRGVSIIELLIGLGVVLAIAAIVIPWTTGWLGSRELDNAEDGLTMQMMMARAAAREEGRPVELIAQSDDTGSRISARWMNGSDDAPARSTRRDGERARSALDASGDDAATIDAARIDASWADMPLPRGVRIALGLETKRTAATDAIPSIDEDDAIASAAARGQTIAIFLPDGTVFFAPTFMLRTDAGSLRAMKVDRATGVPQQIETAPAPSNEFEGDRPEFDSFEDESDMSSDEPSSDGSDGDERASNDRAPSDRATASARLP